MENKYYRGVRRNRNRIKVQNGHTLNAVVSYLLLLIGTLQTVLRQVVSCTRAYVILVRCIVLVSRMCSVRTISLLD